MSSVVIFYNSQIDGNLDPDKSGIYEYQLTNIYNPLIYDRPTQPLCDLTQQNLPAGNYKAVLDTLPMVITPPKQVAGYWIICKFIRT